MAVEQKIRKPIEERFFSKIERIPISGCWLWTGATKKGYGDIFIGAGAGRKHISAHRFSWEFHNGAIPEGLIVCHKCDIHECVNPEHLFLGTHADNMQDCSNKGRICNVGKSRLTHCKYGHELSGDNVIVRITKTGNKQRRCRVCEKIRGKKKYETNKTPELGD